MSYLVTRWIHEAPEDEEQQAPATDAPENADAPQEGEDNQTEDTGDDENFDIDTSLDGDEDEEGEDGGGDEGLGNDEPSGESELSGDSGGDQEPNPANTSIFNTLTAEEQQIKIGELKNLYKDLYSSVNDLLHRIDDMDLNEDIMEPITKVSNILHRLQNSIADYFSNLFDIRSYFENDVKYNEFLLVLKKTTTVVDDLAKSREKRLGKNSPNFEDKKDNI